MKVHHGGRSDVGVVRSNNEDSFGIDAESRLFVVCDGVGGRAAGEHASRLAVDHVVATVAQQRPLLDTLPSDDEQARRGVGQLLERAVSEASRRIRQQAVAQPEFAGMATTVALLLVAGSRAFVAHVGDSRVYLLRSGVLHLLTEDHSLANDMRRRGRTIDAGSMMAQYREALTRALGVLDQAQVDLLDLEVLAGDRFVLCSDGVHGVVGEALMQQLVGTDTTPQDIASALIDAALHKGAPDNATAVVVEIAEGDDDSERARQLRRRLEAIQSVTVFRYLPFADLMRVTGIAREQRLQPGETFFAEGDHGDSMYILLDGEVAVQKSGVDFAVLRAGDHFGEVALIERAARSATVRARTSVAALVIDREAFYGLLSEEQTAVKLLWGLVRMLNARLRSTSDELTTLKMDRQP
jgi:serine/threonine protein phosphatase PrpC